MYKTEVSFKAGQLNNLNNQKFEITKQDEQLFFYVEGKCGEDVYSFDFITTITECDLLKIKVGEKVDFIKFVDDGDIVVGINDVYTLVTNIDMTLVQYLENRFFIEIFFKTEDDFVGEMGLTFSLDES